MQILFLESGTQVKGADEAEKTSNKEKILSLYLQLWEIHKLMKLFEATQTYYMQIRTKMCCVR